MLSLGKKVSYILAASSDDEREMWIRAVMANTRVSPMQQLVQQKKANMPGNYGRLPSEITILQLDAMSSLISPNSRESPDRVSQEVVTPVLADPWRGFAGLHDATPLLLTDGEHDHDHDRDHDHDHDHEYDLEHHHDYRDNHGDGAVMERGSDS